MNKFKEGDKVKCIGEDVFCMTKHKQYTITRTEEKI